MRNLKEKFTGCLLGGAIGDALGYPIEFLKIDEIYNRYGKSGIQDLIVNLVNRKSLISDDTQMTLFTVEGILEYENKRKNDKNICIPKSVFYSYERWLYTQGQPLKDEYSWLIEEDESILFEYDELFSQRAPGNSCLNSLIYTKNSDYGTTQNHINNSKGCGGVMRVAPAGLYNLHNSKEAFKMGSDFAAITHGHPTGYLASGAFSSIISDVCSGHSIEVAVRNALELLRDIQGNEETVNLLNQAVSLAELGEPSTKKLSKLGEGWIAEEALAIAVYCALSYPKNFEEALKLSVNHSGDSDSTGSICGNIMGAKLGISSIPKKWIDKLELCDLIKEMAEKLYRCVGIRINE